MKLRRLFSLFFVTLLAVAPLLLSAEEEAEKTPAIYYFQMKPALVANLYSGGRYVRCDIQLMTHDKAFLEVMRLHAPAIRHILLLLLSEQDGNRIKTPGGKETLRSEALSQINRMLKKQSGKGEIESLFFTTFFVQ